MSKLITWSHKKLNNIFLHNIKTDILKHLDDIQKTEAIYRNHGLFLDSLFPFYGKQNLEKAVNELVDCGYLDRSQSHLSLTNEGEHLLKCYNRFYYRGILSKITWWFKNNLECPWKLLWICMLLVVFFVHLLLLIFLL
ncbi:MAG: hypothetical protein K0R12_444 [Gammaproteobacteria bacterium]|jgi:hypothetical protein|nr:hypothetical protein [Gammaproteobacteria bacterium]